MSDRLSFNSQIECDDIFTPEFQTLLVNLHDKFNDEVKQIRKERIENQEKARNGISLILALRWIVIILQHFVTKQ